MGTCESYALGCRLNVFLAESLMVDGEGLVFNCELSRVFTSH